MADYTDLPDTAVGISGIPSGTTVTALRDNPIAIAERAVGAPLVVGATNDLLARTVISGTPANVDFTFDATNYDEIVFRLANVVPGTDVTDLWLRTSTDGGSTYDSGSSNYAWFYRRAEVSASSVDEFEVDDQDAKIVLTDRVGSGAADDGVFGTVSISAPSLAKKTSVFSNLSYLDNAAQNTFVSGGGTRNSSADVNAVRFLFSAGNFEDGGIISMYGVRNL